MNIIQQQREEIIKNKNVAQQQLEDYVSTILSNATIELKFSSPFHGSLDLAVLDDKKFENLRSIVFSEGEITNITNIPKTLNTLIVPNNLLTELENLPSNLIELNINKNYIKTLDVSYLPDIEILHCDENKLVELKLNSGITEIHCDSNDLKFLDVAPFKHLNVLHVCNNPLLIIDNLETSNIHDFQSENSPLVSLSSKSIVVRSDEKDSDKNGKDGKNGKNGNESLEDDAEKRIDYVTALAKYFKMKQEYEVNALNEKKKKYNPFVSKKENNRKLQAFKPKCIKCKKSCGTIFSFKKNYYTAICGSTENPCKLNIKLFRGDYGDNEEMLLTFKEILEDHKVGIIKQKLDTLLNYITEQTSAAEFKKKLEMYNEDSTLYATSLKKHNELHDNEFRKLSLQKKKNEIYEIQRNIRTLISEYENSNNKEPLKTAIDMYIKNLTPEMQNLQRLRFDVSEIENIKINDKPEIFVSVLHQYENHYTKTEELYGEAPKVEKYVL